MARINCERRSREVNSMVGWGRGTTDKKEANTIGTWYNKCERRLILWLLLTASRNNENHLPQRI